MAFSYSRSFFVALIFTSVPLFSGCDTQPVYELTPVKVRVTIDGKPANDINVQLMPNTVSETFGPTSLGITDAQGVAVMKTVDNRDGAVVGKHLIVLTDMLEERPPQGQPPKKKPRLDSVYSIPSVERTYEVSKNSDTIEVSLTRPR